MDQLGKDDAIDRTELDNLVMRILSLMNQYINCKRNIENYVRSGCLDLAKARYISGNRNISALQLPGEDSVGVTAKFRLIRSNSCDFSKFTSIKYEESEEDTVSESMDQLNLNKEGNSSKRILRFSKDPLKWFGYLVPRSLRQSKVMFEKCLEIIVECANIQSELEHNLIEYRQRKKVSGDYS